MNSNLFVYPYKQGSRSALALAKAVGAKLIRLQGSNFKPAPNKTIINWGSTQLPEEYKVCKVLNSPEKLGVVTNKKTFFESCAAASKQASPKIPLFTTNIEEAKKWFIDGKVKTVFIRRILNGHSGAGIVEVNSLEELSLSGKNGELFVQYIPKRYEYRIHIAKDEPFVIQQKLAKTEFDGEKTFKIRNIANGFIYAKNIATPPEDVLIQAKKAAKLSGLDFAAVDVIYNVLLESAFVLEINSAPGIDGTTIDSYKAMVEAQLK
jgi:glutathione synthase/RimK-type ligase-like ATP-grasp enzyme